MWAEQLGNTCYFNSVVQVLYHIAAFREQLLSHCRAVGRPGADATPLVAALGDLFRSMEPDPRCYGRRTRIPVVSPKAVLRLVQRLCPVFEDQDQQHDAHELLSAVLNGIAEELSHRQQHHQQHHQKQQEQSSEREEELCFVRRLFEGVGVSETQCCGCDSVSRREEPFWVVDIDLPSGANALSEHTLAGLLERRQQREVLTGSECYQCDACCCKQEAARQLLLARLPRVLLLQLKRFAFDSSSGALRKTRSRIVFPQRLCLDQHGRTAVYELVGCVVHVGRGLDSGHYVAVCRTAGQWVLFNDDYVHPVGASWLQRAFGGRRAAATTPLPKAGKRVALLSTHAYLLAYVSRDALGDELSSPPSDGDPSGCSSSDEGDDDSFDEEEDGDGEECKDEEKEEDADGGGVEEEEEEDDCVQERMQVVADALRDFRTVGD